MCVSAMKVRISIHRVMGCFISCIRFTVRQCLSMLRFLFCLRRKILIIGGPGVGKSQVGNILVGKEVFATSVGRIPGTRVFQSTSISGVNQSNCLQTEIVVVDSPALKGDPLVCQHVYLQDNIADVIYLVINGDARFTQDQQLALEAIAKLYKAEMFWDRITVVVSHAASLGSTVNEQKRTFEDTMKDRDCPLTLKWLDRKVRNRILFVESKSTSAVYIQERREELLNMIEDRRSIMSFKERMIMRAKHTMNSLLFLLGINCLNSQEDTKDFESEYTRLM